MTNKIIPGSVLLVLLLLCLPAMLWAWADHNRPDPFMDYVPQGQGLYDTVYAELNSNDCLDCHTDDQG